MCGSSSRRFGRVDRIEISTATAPGTMYHNPQSYLIDAAEAADSEVAADTLDVLLRYGADMNKVKKPPRCWATANYFPGRRLASLRLFLE
ncbi:hypothetical protein N7463_008690 [Penicillium fimorum]|uniref:Uncharacterized protein n=1 Tax=Penicillium fimorum TaxID=1882269 RepID=A0A9X0C3I9_9EURO|nr:hypothetical protein N7463_008690 [Penicillium fimorum]